MGRGRGSNGGPFPGDPDPPPAVSPGPAGRSGDHPDRAGRRDPGGGAFARRAVRARRALLGAIVALETLVADPGPFAGAVLYEPPAPLDGLPLGLPTTLERCAGGHRLGPIQVARWGSSWREGVGVPKPVAALAPLMARVAGAASLHRASDRRSRDDSAAAACRTETYAGIQLPVWFLTGAKSPRAPDDPLRTTGRGRCRMRRSSRCREPGTARIRAIPRQLGDLIADFAAEVLPR